MVGFLTKHYHPVLYLTNPSALFLSFGISSLFANMLTFMKVHVELKTFELFHLGVNVFVSQQR